MPNPGKQVNQSPTVVPAGRGTAVTSTSAPTPLASASIPTVPSRPAMLTSLAAAGRVRVTTDPMTRRSSARRQDVESHWVPVYPGRQPPSRSTVSESACPARPPPAGTGSAVRPRAVTDRAAGTPNWVCPPRTGTPQAREASLSPSTTARTCSVVGAPTASSKPDGGRSHGGEVVEVDEHRAPPGPPRVAVDEGGQDRVAGGDDVRARHGRPVVPEEPRGGAHEAVEDAGERGLRGPGQPFHAVHRVAHEGVRRALHHHVAHVLPAETAEQDRAAPLDRGVEPQRPEVLGVGAGGSHQRRSDAAQGPRPGGDGEPAAPPPADVGFVARGQAHPADDGTVRGPGDEDPTAGVVVRRVPVVAGEHPLLGDEDVPTESAVGLFGGGVGDLDVERRPGTGHPGQDGHVQRREQAVGDGQVRVHGQAPSFCRTEHAPHAAHPRHLVRTPHPGLAQRLRDASRDVLEDGGVRGRGVVDVHREGSRQRAERHDERVHAQLGEAAGPLDEVVGVLAETDEEVRRDLVAPEHADGLGPGGPVVGQRDRRLPRIQRRRTASSRDSTWMPTELAPASWSSVRVARSAGGSHWTCTGSPGTASRIALTQRARWRAPRSGAVDVPVVSTTCRIPSRSTAARVTSARTAGVLTAIVAPEFKDSSIAQNRQRSSGEYREQVWTTVVARTSRPCNRATFS